MVAEGGYGGVGGKKGKTLQDTGEGFVVGGKTRLMGAEDEEAEEEDGVDHC